MYSRPLISEQRQELGHSVILVHLDSPRKHGEEKHRNLLFLREILTSSSNFYQRNVRNGTINEVVSLLFRPTVTQLRKQNIKYGH